MQTGRMLRSMSFARMVNLEAGGWRPSVDIYESGDSLILYCDLAGAERESLELLVADEQVLIRGRRRLASSGSIVCVHQLEIELGVFERTVTLPSPVDLDRVESSYEDGILMVSLKKRRESQVVVRIQIGG